MQTLSHAYSLSQSVCVCVCMCVCVGVRVWVALIETYSDGNNVGGYNANALNTSNKISPKCNPTHLQLTDLQGGRAGGQDVGSIITYTLTQTYTHILALTKALTNIHTYILALDLYVYCL